MRLNCLFLLKAGQRVRNDHCWGVFWRVWFFNGTRLWKKLVSRQPNSALHCWRTIFIPTLNILMGLNWLKAAKKTELLTQLHGTAWPKIASEIPNKPWRKVWPNMGSVKSFQFTWRHLRSVRSCKFSFYWICLFLNVSECYWTVHFPFTELFQKWSHTHNMKNNLCTSVLNAELQN